MLLADTSKQPIFSDVHASERGHELSSTAKKQKQSILSDVRASQRGHARAVRPSKHKITRWDIFFTKQLYKVKLQLYSFSVKYERTKREPKLSLRKILKTGANWILKRQRSVVFVLLLKLVFTLWASTSENSPINFIHLTVFIETLKHLLSSHFWYTVASKYAKRNKITSRGCHLLTSIQQPQLLFIF